MAVNVLFLLGTVLLVARIARELCPDRERLAIAPPRSSRSFRSRCVWRRCFTQRRCALSLHLALCFACARRGYPLLRSRLSGAWIGAARSRLRPLGGRGGCHRACRCATLALARGRPRISVLIRCRVRAPQLTYSGPAPFPRPPTPQARTGGLESGKPKTIFGAPPTQVLHRSRRSGRDHTSVHAALPQSRSADDLCRALGRLFGVWAWKSGTPPASPRWSPARARTHNRSSASCRRCSPLRGGRPLLLAPLRRPAATCARAAALLGILG